MSALSIREARARLAELADRAERSGQRFTITRRGRASVVLMSAEEFDSWVETLEILSSRIMVRQLRGSAKDLVAGRTVSLETVKKRLAK
jgi:prevent-host-death family protein